MPLSKIQTVILRLLASHRDPESRNTFRYSADIFHDREERVARAAQEDSAFLSAGLSSDRIINEIRRTAQSKPAGVS